MNFATTLKDTRTRLRLSQQRMAEALGLSHRMLCYFESGKYEPKPASETITREGLEAKLRILETMEPPVRKHRAK